MRELGIQRPYDEELVCIAETNACGVDAIQMVTGCTAGKGNLIIHDYGKHVFTFISRESKRAVRILVRREDRQDQSEMDSLRKNIFSGTATADEQSRFTTLMKGVAAYIRAMPETDILEIREVKIEPPGKARIFTSITCARCNEPVADGKTRIVGGSRVCMPCAEMIVRESGNSVL